MTDNITTTENSGQSSFNMDKYRFKETPKGVRILIDVLKYAVDGMKYRTERFTSGSATELASGSRITRLAEKPRGFSDKRSVRTS